MPKRCWPTIWYPSPGKRSSGASQALGRYLAGRPSAFPVIEAPYAVSRGGQWRDVCVWPRSSGRNGRAGDAGTQRHRRTSRHQRHPARQSATRRSSFSSGPLRILTQLPSDRHHHHRCPAALAHNGPCHGKTSLTLVTCWLLDAIVPGAPLRYLVFAEKRRGGDCEITRPGYSPARHH